MSVAIVPLVGFSPHSHVGHAKDLGNTLRGMKVRERVVGISAKANYFSDDERINIFKTQLRSVRGSHAIVSRISTSATDTVRFAMGYSIRGPLHIVVGIDRLRFGTNLRQSILDGNVEDVPPDYFSSIEIEVPDTKRDPELSGTIMRHAAKKSDLECYHRHLGHAFTRSEAAIYMDKTARGIEEGKISITR